jgi:hypothetical protein
MEGELEGIAEVLTALIAWTMWRTRQWARTQQRPR